MGNGEWGMGSGEWGIRNSVFSHSPFPTPYPCYCQPPPSAL
jgi:hypothetical protein